VGLLRLILLITDAILDTGREYDTIDEYCNIDDMVNTGYTEHDSIDQAISGYMRVNGLFEHAMSHMGRMSRSRCR